MQVNSDVHCHSRLLFKPKPNGSGREYQLSPRRRVSHDITYKIIGLKIPWNQHLQKKVGVGVSRLPPFSLSTCCPASLKAARKRRALTHLAAEAILEAGELSGSACEVTPSAASQDMHRVYFDHNATTPVDRRVLEARGVEVTYVPVNREGRVDPEDIRHAIRPETVLITVMHANNELGTLQPIEEIGRIAAEADVYFHSDAVQSAGKVLLDVNRLGVDLLSISGHKLYASKGVGALYIRKGTRLEPLLYGGHHQRDRRPRTANVARVVGLGTAGALPSGGLSH